MEKQKAVILLNIMRNYKKLAFILLLSALPSFAQSNKPLEGLNIMLDPGHGGADPGAVGKLGLKESDTNLRVARYLKMLLEHDGANVSLTRDQKDTFISLKDRVKMSKEQNPDLFVSIHHNASISKQKVNHSEIYYDAKDGGISRIVATAMNEALEENNFAGKSKLIPGGFYVLRANEAPAILTEGSYISIPESEKNLRSGKGLTNEASIYWKAIRQTLSKGIFNLKVYTGKEDNSIWTDSPYFDILFEANKQKAIKRIDARLNSTELHDLEFKYANVSLPTGITFLPTSYYYMNSTKPLNSGKYKLSFAAVSTDGAITPQQHIDLTVELPINKITIKTVAPYIPLGFKGRFPISIYLLDKLDRINTRSASIKIKCGKEKRHFAGYPNGITPSYITLDGTESGEVTVVVTTENELATTVKIPVAMPVQRYVMGKIVGLDNKGIANAKISHKGEIITTSNNAGFFYLTYPLNKNEFSIDVSPSSGYEGFSETIKTDGEPVVLPTYKAQPVEPAFLGKKIAIMAQPQLEEMTRNIIRPLSFAGAIIKRLNLPQEMANPEYQAVLEANLADRLDLLLSIKSENNKGIEIRHYHNSKKGKKIAESIKDSFTKSYPDIPIKSCVGSDYELGHTNAVAVVISIPNSLDTNSRNALLNQISDAIKISQK